MRARRASEDANFRWTTIQGRAQNDITQQHAHTAAAHKIGAHSIRRSNNKHNWRQPIEEDTPATSSDSEATDGPLAAPRKRRQQLGRGGVVTNSTVNNSSSTMAVALAATTTATRAMYVHDCELENWRHDTHILVSE